MESLAWPLVVLVLGLTFFWIFRKPIERLLDRTKKVGASGIETAQVRQETGRKLQPSRADELMRLFDNALLVEREQLILRELEQLIGNDQSERERILVRLMASGSIIFQFEAAYASMFGSQLTALLLVNQAGPDGFGRQVLEDYYSKVVAENPDFYKDLPFDRWLAYLEDNQFLASAEEAFFITLAGKEFLKYIVHQGYSTAKHG